MLRAHLQNLTAMFHVSWLQVPRERELYFSRLCISTLRRAPARQLVPSRWWEEVNHGSVFILSLLLQQVITQRNTLPQSSEAGHLRSRRCQLQCLVKPLSSSMMVSWYLCLCPKVKGVREHFLQSPFRGTSIHSWWQSLHDLDISS